MSHVCVGVSFACSLHAHFDRKQRVNSRRGLGQATGQGALGLAPKHHDAQKRKRSSSASAGGGDGGKRAKKKGDKPKSKKASTQKRKARKKADKKPKKSKAKKKSGKKGNKRSSSSSSSSGSTSPGNSKREGGKYHSQDQLVSIARTCARYPGRSPGFPAPCAAVLATWCRHMGLPI
ncbi:unnamed protein product [Prorocentrum cordatum]|uniref:Uncharacterized protein n=1 Tax=Prorocentrum cordatum TaxID=2364126 RepID=A0ABN9TL37_9DINO|nr:unnamed protein product [Polarella glacialis]